MDDSRHADEGEARARGAAVPPRRRDSRRGSDARVGLHSLPQADGFYTNTCGMTDLGTDPEHEGLRYFEMTPEQARAFVRKGRKL